MKHVQRQESPSEIVLRKAREAIARYRMVERGDEVLIAVSGGADSLALLRVLLALREELEISLRVAHLNHGIRGEVGDRDEGFVRDLAARFALPYSTEKADVPAIRKERKLSLEEAARRVRYDFLNRVAAEIGTRRIAVGHTADDRVETFLLNLARGTGPRGLYALAAVSDKIIRPLIHVRRAEILAYLQELEQSFREDETNLLPAYARNRVRRVTLPFLEEQHPGISDRITSLCEILSAEQELLDNLVAGAIGSVALKQDDEEVVLSAEGLLYHPLGMRRLILRRAIERVKGDLRDVGLEQIERILSRLISPDDFGLSLPSGGLAAIRRGDKLCIRKKPKPLLPHAFCEPLMIPGRVDIPGVGVITAETWDPADYLRPPRSNDVVVDADEVAGKLTVRNWRPGDRIRPLGMEQERKLQDVFVDAKIPAAERRRIPLIADEKKVIWVAGLAMSEMVKVESGTRRAVRLAFTRF